MHKDAVEIAKLNHDLALCQGLIEDQSTEIKLCRALIKALYDRMRGRADLPFSHDLGVAENALHQFDKGGK